VSLIRLYARVLLMLGPEARLGRGLAIRQRVAGRREFRRADPVRPHHLPTFTSLPISPIHFPVHPEVVSRHARSDFLRPHERAEVRSQEKLALTVIRWNLQSSFRLLRFWSLPDPSVLSASESSNESARRRYSAWRRSISSSERSSTRASLFSAPRTASTNFRKLDLNGKRVSNLTVLNQKHMRNVTMVVPVFMTSCHVSL